MLARRAFLEGLVVALLELLYGVVRVVTDAATDRPSGTVESEPDGLTVINHHWATFEDDEGVRVTLRNTGDESANLILVNVTFYDSDGQASSLDLELEGTLEPGDRIERDATCGCEQSEIERYEISVSELFE